MRTRSRTSEVKLVKTQSHEVKQFKKEVEKSQKSTLPKSKNARQKKVSLSQNVVGIGAADKLLNTVKVKKGSRSSKSNSKRKEPEEEEKSYTLNKEDFGKPKPFTKHDSEVAKLTEWIDITILELHDILQEERKHHKDCEEEEICPICR
jgi:hypothetical protein